MLPNTEVVLYQCRSDWSGVVWNCTVGDGWQQYNGISDFFEYELHVRENGTVAFVHSKLPGMSGLLLAQARGVERPLTYLEALREIKESMTQILKALMQDRGLCEVSKC
jgi:hypothetical protein